jgi:hypothetical protein
MCKVSQYLDTPIASKYVKGPFDKHRPAGLARNSPSKIGETAEFCLGASR